MIDRLGRLVDELRERRAVRFIVGYIVAGWIAVQVAGFFVEQGYVSRRLLDVSLFLVAVGFVAMLVLVWFHGERGHQKVQRLEAVLLGALFLVAAGGAAWIGTRVVSSRSDAAAVIDLGDNSVAVLPFTNQVVSPDYEWLDRGIADLLATDLSQFDTLRVVSGQRIFDVLRQLGREETRTVPGELQTEVTRLAGARYTLTGSIIGSPQNLQIVATLSDVRSGDIRASSRARGADVFALVDRISAEISSDLLGRPISPAESAPVAQLTTNSLEAYREFDAGRDALWKFLNQEARGHFERAIQLDSTFALAHFQLAGLLFRLGDYSTATGHLQSASRHLGTANERDRLMIGAFLDLMQGEVESGERKFDELLRRYPDEKDARVIYAGLLQGQLGRPEEAERLMLEVLELDPFYPEAWNMLAYARSRTGDHEGADTLIQRYLELQPGEPNPLDSRGEILEFAGRLEEARTYYRQALEVREDFAVSLGHLARTYLREQRFADAREEIAAYRVSESPDTRVWAWWLVADTRMWEGDVDGALATYDSLVAVAASSGRPDLHAQTLDGLVRTLILLERFERADRVADSLRLVRGADGVTAAARLHALGSEGRIAEMERSVAETLEAEALESVPGSFLRAAEAGLGALVEYYRGRPDEVVRIASEFNAGATFPLVQQGYPIIRSALEVGDVDLARAGVSGMMFVALAPEFRVPPLESIHRRYFNARIAELEGDTGMALDHYGHMIDSWGDSLSRVPLFADVVARHEALSTSEQ